MFKSRGFNVRENNNTERIVRKSWPTDSRDILDDAEFRKELAEAFVMLVETTDAVLEDA